MKDFITNIDSQKISELVCNLCEQANIFIPKDVYTALLNSYLNESCEKGKYTLSQILGNLKLAANNFRPICQDTGIVVVFIDIGQNVIITGNTIENAINKGVAKAYKDNFFRKSIVNNPVFERINTNTNTPAIIYTNIVAGNNIKITVSIKGCGCENMSAVKMLKPSSGKEGIVDFIMDTLKNAGANTCPPVRLGIGIGGTMEYAAILAKKALLEPVKIDQNSDNSTEPFQIKLKELEMEILDRVNSLKIGAGGLGGDITAFGVNILSHPTHIAALPVAVNINCHASRQAQGEIIDNNITYKNNHEHEFKEFVKHDLSFKEVDLDNLPAIKSLNAGENVLLSGYIYTARDAAHKKLLEHIDKGETLPIDIKNKIIYYTGPCPPTENEIIGPAGPTTSSRMDKYTPELMDKGLLGTIGKGPRSKSVIESIKTNKGIYFAATGGIANLLGQKVIESKIIAYEELGTEAIYKFKIKDFPVIVAIDSNGNSIFA